MKNQALDQKSLEFNNLSIEFKGCLYNNQDFDDYFLSENRQKKNDFEKYNRIPPNFLESLYKISSSHSNKSFNYYDDK